MTTAPNLLTEQSDSTAQSDLYQLTPIAKVYTCYKERFAIPRQPLLAPSVTSEIELLPPYNTSEAVCGLESTSHLWIQFIFHEIDSATTATKVRAPRLGGNQRTGVLATRSPFRANRLGLSVVKLKTIEFRAKTPWLVIQGADLLDKTPILDIKPYLPYVDSVTSAYCNFAPNAPKTLRVVLSNQATEHLKRSEPKKWPVIMQQLIEILQQDPRPAYHSLDTDRIYGSHLWQFNVKWRYSVEDVEPKIQVLSLDSMRAQNN